MGSVLVLVALVACGFVGWLLGSRHGKAQVTSGGIQPSALAQAWQEGRDSALREEASASLPTVETGAPGDFTPATALAKDGDFPPVLPRPLEDGPKPVHAMANVDGIPAQRYQTHPSPLAPSHHQVPAPGQTPPMVGVRQPPPPRSAQEREKATLRNINITLYAASLLLVAAASLFIGLAMPPLAKFGGLVAVTTMFYVAGLLIHAFSERLRPAGMAFAGTGLALIPVSGLALSALVVHDPVTAWWVTSLVGTAAFVYAAARLDSRVVAYLSLTFLVSSAWSGGAVLNRGLFWYFMFSMVLAAVGTALAYGRPGWLGNLYLRAFTETHRFLAPATLLAAILLGQTLGAEDLSLLLIAGTIYYVAVTIFGPAAERALNLVAGRVCATGAIVLLAYVFGAGPWGMARTLGIVLLLQAVAVHYAGERYRRFVAPQVRALVGIEIQGLLAGAAALVLVLNEAFNGGGSTGWASINYLLLLVALSSAALSARGRKFLPWIALLMGLAGLLEPGVVLSPWRQVAFLVVGLACAVPGLRLAVGRHFRRLRRGILAVLPIGLTAIGAWAASGFLVTTSTSGPSLTAWFFGDPSRWAEGGTETRDLMIIAILIFVISWMALAALAAWTLEAGFMLSSLVVVVVTEVRLSSLESGGDPWTTAVALAALVLSVLGSNTLLETLSRGSGRAARRKSLIAQGVAPLVIVGTWLASFEIENRWLVLAVCLTALSHAAWRLFRAVGAKERLAYAVTAQLFFSLSILELSYQLHADAHVRWAVFAISLAVGQTARLWTRRRGDGTPSTYGSTISNATLVLLFLGPLVYFGIHGGPGSGVDMVSLLVQYFCLLSVGLLKWRTDVAAPNTASSMWRTVTRMQILVVAYAWVWLLLIPSGLISLRQGGWLTEPLWNTKVLLVLLLMFSVLMMGFEALAPDTALRRRVTSLLAGREGAGLLGRSGPGPENSAHPMARAIAVAGYLGFAAAVVLGGSNTSAGSNPATVPGGDLWFAAILLAATAGCVVFAVTRGLPLLLSGAIVFLPWAVSLALAQWVGDPESRVVLSKVYMISAVSSAVLLYAAGWLQRPQTRDESGLITAPRSWSWLHARFLTGGAIVVLFIDGFEANVMQSREGPAGPATTLAYIGTFMIAVAAVATVAEFPRRHRERSGEVAALVIAGCAQHAWHLAYGQPGWFWMTQYWVILFALLAAYEIRAGRRKDADYPLIASAVLLSGSAPFGLALEQGWGQAWLLLAHVLLLAAGLLLNRRLYVVWGAVAAALMILWFLRGFTILLLAFLAAGLIALAIWRLQRLGKDKEVPQAPVPEPEGPDSAPPAPTQEKQTGVPAPEQQKR